MGTTFDWPETTGGANASYTCPNNATVTRRCEAGGLWQDFDRAGCVTSQYLTSPCFYKINSHAAYCIVIPTCI